MAPLIPPEALARFERLRRRADHLHAASLPLSDREENVRNQIAKAILALRDAAQGRAVEVDEAGRAFFSVMTERHENVRGGTVVYHSPGRTPAPSNLAGFA